MIRKKKDDDDDDSSLNDGEIAGVVIGTLAGLALIFAALGYFLMNTSSSAAAGAGASGAEGNSRGGSLASSLNDNPNSSL